ncbi:MAG: hypothetical protein DCC68_14475 [Planctomycetota bacterium]|nr:MAG: hypothetical protein DCC68_14475 [Planctomycetota bacterium]
MERRSTAVKRRRRGPIESGGPAHPPNQRLPNDSGTSPRTVVGIRRKTAIIAATTTQPTIIQVPLSKAKPLPTPT